MKWIIASLVLANLVVFYLYHNGMVSNGVSLSPALPVIEPDSRLQLLEEGRPQLAVIPEEPVVEPLRSCYLLEGVDEEQAVSLASELEGLQLGFQQQTYQQQSVVNYWVHVPALPTLADARALHNKIRDFGIKDVYVIEAGKNRNSVSLGLYSDKAAADERVTWFNRKRVEAVVTERYKSTTMYRFELEVVEQQQLDLEKMLAGQFNSLSYQKKSCKGL